MDVVALVILIVIAIVVAKGVYGVQVSSASNPAKAIEVVRSATATIRDQVGSIRTGGGPRLGSAADVLRFVVLSPAANRCQVRRTVRREGSSSASPRR